MLTARRMRERMEADAAGQPPQPSRPRRTEIPWYEHETALAALETRLRAELGATPATTTLDDAVVDTRAQLLAEIEALKAWKASLLPADHKRTTLEEFVAAGYQPELYDEHMADWERELVHADSVKRIAEIEGANTALTEQFEAARKELLEFRANAGEPAAKAELAGEAQATPPADAQAATPSADEGSKTKGGKPKPR